jgi:uncharacterized repeat protein (TIGR01451 family)
LVVLIVLVVLLSQATVVAVTPQSVSEDGLWREVVEGDLQIQGERWIVPEEYRTLRLHLADLQTVLAQASTQTAIVIALPLPDGTFGRFRVAETAVMHPQLAAKFPEIKTYAGMGLDDARAAARLDVTPAGFHGMILSAGETVYIDPYSRQDSAHYISYYRHDLANPHEGFIQHEPIGDPAEIEALVEALQEGGGNIPSGDELRTYRLVVAATGEYTQYHGGTVPAAMAAIVTAVNRVVGIYIRDTAVNMQLVANNDLVIYTDGTTDPYTNNSGGQMLGQNQTNLDNVIGNANYDIGHVFSTGGGGIASLGVPCETNFKARGVTGLSNPIGDPFYVDYVAHEMGHQYGANHTFNGTAGSCGGSRWGPTAYEPGSGTTIMAYAGICGAQDIQPNSDDYFHTGSIDEIRAYTVSGFGNTCPVITNTANLPPTVNAGPDYTIPLDTPFTLSGSASDPNGDPLTYNWEQFDVGPAGHPDSPSGNAPLFRSFSSVLTSTRTFPQISDIVNNGHTLGELLPGYGRNMKFRLTVRDNQTAAGGVNVDEMDITVAAGAGPFLVTAPNTAVTWNSGQSESVTWDVANTDQAPVNCAEVDIRLSLDGGYTYPVLVEANRPNDGSEEISVPNMPTTQARIKVMCSDNIFFDISDNDFTIVAGPTSLHLAKSVDALPEPVPGDALQYTIVMSNTGITSTAVITDVFPAHLDNISCNGVAGDLFDMQVLAPQAQVTYTCTAEIEPTLAIGISKEVDQAEVMAGTAVTYTITVSNPQNDISLTDVTVADPQAQNCLPDLGDPVSIGSGGSQSYVCANNVITQSLTNTAVVTGFYELVNVAEASLVGGSGLVISNEVSTAVALSESAAASVQVTLFRLYLPFLGN